MNKGKIKAGLAIKATLGADETAAILEALITQQANLSNELFDWSARDGGLGTKAITQREYTLVRKLIDRFQELKEHAEKKRVAGE